MTSRNAPETTTRPRGTQPAAPPPPSLPEPGARIDAKGVGLRRLLASGDWVALMVALCVATAATATTTVGGLFWAVLFSPVWILVLKVHGLYDNDHRRIRHSTFDELSRLISASAIGTLLLDGLLALSPAGALSSESAILVGVVSFFGCFLSRATVRFVWHRTAGVATGIVIGPQSAAEMVARRVATHPETRLRLIGYLADQPTNGGEGQLPRLGAIDDVHRVAQRYGVERVVVTELAMSASAAERLIEKCKAAGLALTFLPQHHGLLGPGIELNRLAELPVLDFRFSDPPRSTIALKRATDVVVSGVLLALLLPLLAAVALVILLDSGRPVFFRQKRAGKDGAPFMMLKFRTMVVDAEERLSELVDLEELDEPVFKIQNDPRITRSGRFLRRTSLDEIPQFINVLKGEMSLVGPRPEEEAVVALYDERQRMRLAVKPGLTGPMQVYGRGDLTFEERLAIERDYLDNLSVTGDLAIILRTPAAVIRGDGAY